MAQKQIPTPVKVISVLYYIGAIYYFLATFGLTGGITLAAGVDIISSAVKVTPFAGLSLVILGLSIFEFFVAMGLWKSKKWARISVIILSIAGISLGILLLARRDFRIFDFDVLFTLLTNGLIAFYLIFSKKTRQAFE